MSAIENNNTTTVPENISFVQLELPAVVSWEELADITEDIRAKVLTESGMEAPSIPEPVEPEVATTTVTTVNNLTKLPTTAGKKKRQTSSRKALIHLTVSSGEKTDEPVKISIVATMEIFMEELDISRPAPKIKSGPAPRIKAAVNRQVMTLSEYRAELERKEAERKAQEEAEKNKPSAKALHRKKAKEQARAKKNEGWESAEKPKPKEEIEKTNLRIPIGWSKDLYKPTPPAKGQATNTTLILKNLPRTGVCDKDIKRFFTRHAGPIKFVNILYADDGKCKGIAFIRFETKEGSNRGLTLNKFLYENRMVYVEYAEDRRK